jgi:DNA-directed RNA polymerase subunit K/omega
VPDLLPEPVSYRAAAGEGTLIEVGANRGVESRFMFVNVAALRAKQLFRGASPRVPMSGARKFTTIARTEVAEGAIPFRLPNMALPSIGVVDEGRSAEGLDITMTGGPTLEVATPDALTVLRTSFQVMARSSENPLGDLQEAIDRGVLGSLLWLRWSSSIASKATTRPQDDFDAALEAVELMWRDVEHPDHMTAVVTLARSWEPAITLECPAGAVAVYQGSLRLTLCRALVKPTAFVIALARRKGMPSIQADSIRASLRSAALQKPGVEVLEPIDVIDADTLAGKTGLVIFVHGLISTDIGVFDALIRRLRRERPTVQLVGFPHDTFTHILTNRDILVNWCRATLQTKDRLPVVFIAHSRGGLVARAVAATLFGGKGGESWRQQIRGCVTFGTPHLGAALAESPEEMAPILAMLAVREGCKNVWSVADVLTYYGAGGEFHGIHDLKPQSQQPADGFFAKLNELESDGGRVDLMAVGGTKEPSTWVSRLIGRALASQPHDHVVEQASTLGKQLFIPVSLQRAVTCDHFSYFADTPFNLPTLVAATEFVTLRLGAQRNDQARPA